MSSGWLHLDPAIRDYVLLPIVAVVVLTSVLRTNLTLLLGKPAPPGTKPPTFEELRFLTLFSRVARFRENAAILSEERFSAKRALYLSSSDKRKGLLLAAPPTQLSPVEKMMQQNQDPSAALDMVKGQFMFLGIHGSVGYLVSSLFSGFLVAKTPFPLTFKIKGMLQRGVEVPALDTSYVSSLSWYFFVMMSVNGVIALWNYLWSGAAADQDDSQQAVMMAAMGGMNQMPATAAQVDIPKQLESERENLQVLSHSFSLETAELDLIELWQTPEE